MNLRELIHAFRTLANDKVKPYFIEDVSVIAWLNDAVQEACLRGRLLHESHNLELCQIQINSGTSIYSLHKSLYELTRIMFKAAQWPVAYSLPLMSVERLDTCLGLKQLERTDGFPVYAIQTDLSIRLVPTPRVDGLLQLEGYRLPLSAMLKDTDAPEINQIHHVHLVQWALHQAFTVPDAEFFDPNRSVLAEQAFSNYFGLRPDSDLRRSTRLDQPQHVVPFMP